MLRDHPEMVVDALVFRTMPGVPRREALNTLHRMADQGWITLTGKRSRTEIAGAMVTLCAVPVALDRQFRCSPDGLPR